MNEFSRVVESPALKLALKTLLALMLLVARANAFSLLGPHEDWMQATNGLRYSTDIGGPMNLGEEHRWNVPVLTYAFDQSFLDYFGSNGVAAVESAVAIMNALPPASQINPNTYPPEATQFNYAAQAQDLMDLKSQALSLLLEQLGLAAPTRHVFCLRNFSVTGSNITDPVVIQRNFDPVSSAPSSNVNNTVFSYRLLNYSASGVWDAVEFPVDPLSPVRSAVADGGPERGGFFSGLTRDDVGGLRYLLRTNNSNLEILLPGVHGIGPNAGSYMNEAIRPGIDKITFVRPPYDSLLGQFFTPFTNQFTDKYIMNNAVVTQQVERVVQQPDFIFSSGDTSRIGFGATLVARTGTSNWWNGGSPGLAGPGLIRPPVRITFGRWSVVRTDDRWPEGDAFVENLRWGSFDNSTNPPVTYPLSFVPSNDMTVHLLLYEDSSIGGPFVWQLSVLSGEAVTLQASTNLASWVTLTTLTNQGVPVWWYHHRSQSQRFFRVVPN